MSQRKLYRPSWAAWISLLAHFVWITVFWYIIWAAPAGRGTFLGGDTIEVPYCQPCDAVANSIAAAGEMGRLDIVAVALAVLGVALAVMAIGSFFVVRSAAMHAAREEAKAEAERLLPGLVGSELLGKVLQERPHLLYIAMQRARASEPDVSGEEADAIAAEVSEEEKNGQSK